MSADTNHALEDVAAALRADGFLAEVVGEPQAEVVVSLPDPRLDPWEDPNEERIIELVRVQYRDGLLHCPWLPGPIPLAEAHGLGDILKTLMASRGY
jgi:hypothetical protein